MYWTLWWLFTATAIHCLQYEQTHLNLIWLTQTFNTLSFLYFVMKAKVIRLLALAVTIVIAGYVIGGSLTQPVSAGWWMTLKSGDAEGVVENSGDNAYISWGANKGDGIAFFFRGSTDNGNTFGPKISLVNSTEVNGGDMEALDNSVYIVWEDNKTGNSDTFFRKSTDNGATWSEPINLSNDTGATVEPQVIVSDNNIYVGWKDVNTASAQNETFFTSSNDDGDTFNSVINLSNSTQSDSDDLSIDAEGNNIGVFWWERGSDPDQPTAAFSTDGGETFGETIILSNATTPIVDAKESTEQ